MSKKAGIGIGILGLGVIGSASSLPNAAGTM